MGNMHYIRRGKDVRCSDWSREVVEDLRGEGDIGEGI